MYSDKCKDGFTVHQKSYAERLQLLLENCNHKAFRSCRAQLAWLIHSRPDIACDFGMAAQVTENNFKQQHVIAINKVIKRVKDTAVQGLKMQKTDPEHYTCERIHILHSETTMTSRHNLGILPFCVTRRTNVTYYITHLIRVVEVLAKCWEESGVCSCVRLRINDETRTRATLR